MTEITYNKGHSCYNIQIVGHANYNEPGQDIVCAAISMLNYTLIGALDRIPSTQIKKKYNVASGYSGCRAEIKEGADPTTSIILQAIYQTIAGGLELLADQYPEHVKYVEI